MEVLVDGSRTDPEYWLESQAMPESTVPPISPDEHRVAQALSLSDEQYSRSKYAIEKTRAQLERRAERFGEMVNFSLKDTGIGGKVRQVWLSTYRGEYRLNLMKDAAEVQIVVAENIADALLNSDIHSARTQLEALLASHLAIRPAA